MNLPMSDLSPIQSDELEQLASDLEHGFFTRAGGISSGVYSGLNTGLGSGDNREMVLENRRRVADRMGVDPGNLMTPYQIHSSEVLIVDKPWQGTTRPQVDGLVTSKPGLAIGILSADCGPVLFCDPESRVIGAAHAGWKGAIGGVLDSVLQKMESLGAERNRTIAVLGPTISRKNYEVGPEFVQRLMDHDDCTKYLSPSRNTGHAMFDLPAFIVDKLDSLGARASWTGQCTYDDEKRFFSYRRKTHRGEPDYGRQVSVIALRS